MEQTGDIVIMRNSGIIVGSCVGKSGMVIRIVGSDVGIWIGWSVGEIDGLTVSASSFPGILN